MNSSTVILAEACRCCLLEDQNMVHVFDVLDEFGTKISDLIERHGRVTILQNDVYSKQICFNCLDSVAKSERFSLRCQKTMNLLLNLVIEQLNCNDNAMGAIADPGNHQSESVVSYATMTPVVSGVDSTGTATQKTNLLKCVLVDDIKISELVRPKVSETDEDMSMYCTEEGDREEIIHEEVELVTEQSTQPLNSIITNERNIVHSSYVTIVKDSTLLEQTSVNSSKQRVVLLDNPTNNDMEYYIEEEDEVDETDAEAHGVYDDYDSHPVIERRQKQFEHCCEQCGASFVLTKHFAIHLRVHDMIACKHCLETFNSDDDCSIHESKCRRSINSECSRKKFPCPQCGKNFICASALLAHVRTHTGERPFECKYCGKRFSTPTGQDLHERRHLGIKPHQCQICGRRFTESSNLEVHVRSHKQEKPHICTVCNRPFGRIYLLQLHMRTHTGEKPHICETCGKGFAQHGDLAAHRRIHSGQRPYACEICEKTFTKSNTLSQHRKTHEKQRL
ncbi:zinc finger protein 436-like [Anopheles albimanus]|uniref:zinc finger protein 436-like n=1 Tax=Anopheles albimanus TaxID=7167 RepID=UPI00163E2B21|nr:zinc finger protein 436-like [Anopheles albimanus]XP_035781849.1 zinc finger protein 436-like [Anopheles albimanus]